MTVISVPGSELYYEFEGSGLPCLVMHGGLGLDHTLFRPWLDPLNDLFQWVYYDHRGNGRSAPALTHEITFERLTADANALRAGLGFDRTAILSNSFGSFIALEYAWRFPERVSHLIMVGAAPKLDYLPEAIAAAAQKNPPPAVLAALTQPMGDTDREFGQTWRTLLPLYFHATFSQKLAEKAFEATVYRAAAAAANPALISNFDMCARLSEIQVPVLIVVGEDDFITPPAQAFRLQAGLPNAEVVVMPQTGHFPFIEQPQVFETILREWFTRNQPV